MIPAKEAKNGGGASHKRWHLKVHLGTREGTAKCKAQVPMYGHSMLTNVHADVTCQRCKRWVSV